MFSIDSNVFLIDRFFKRDSRYPVNNRFVQKLPELDASISIYTLLELCGLASFNLSPKELRKWFYHFDELYGVDILYPKDLDSTLQQYLRKHRTDMFRYFLMQMTYPDAKILSMAEEYNISHFVTWNVKHFENRTSIKIVTPEDLLKLFTGGGN